MENSSDDSSRYRGHRGSKDLGTSPPHPYRMDRGVGSRKGIDSRPDSNHFNIYMPGLHPRKERKGNLKVAALVKPDEYQLSSGFSVRPYCDYSPLSVVVVVHLMDVCMDMFPADPLCERYAGSISPEVGSE